MDHQIIQTILRFVKKNYLPEKRHNPKYPDTFTSGDLHFFAPAVADLSALFTFDRSARAKNYFSTKEARSSYLLYFLIPNMLKVEWILKQQRLAEVFANEPEVRIADIGSGPCTGLLAAVPYWKEHAPQQKLKCVAVDQNGPMLKAGRALLDRIVSAHDEEKMGRGDAEGLSPSRALGPSSAVRYGDPCERARHPSVSGPVPIFDRGISADTIVANITTSELRKKLGAQKFHVLILANVLNEFGSMEDRYKFVRMLIETHLEKNGRIIIVEPALQRATRDLMALRDQLCVRHSRPGLKPAGAGSSGNPEDVSPVAKVLAPCLHQALCPMRANNPRDWCHTYISWERPQVIADLDMLIGNKKDYLKMSYMVMVQTAVTPAASSTDKRGPRTGSPLPLNNTVGMTNMWRVVSAPMKSKGKLEILFCGKKDGKLLRVTRLDKDRSKFNAALDQLQRGDLVEYAGEAKCGRETIVAMR